MQPSPKVSQLLAVWKIWGAVSCKWETFEVLVLVFLNHLGGQSSKHVLTINLFSNCNFVNKRSEKLKENVWIDKSESD